MLGMAYVPPQATAQQPQNPLGATQVGAPPPVAPAGAAKAASAAPPQTRPAAAPARPMSGKQTLLGMSMPDLGGLAASTPAAGPPAVGQPAAAAANKRTLVGTAPVALTSDGATNPKAAAGGVPAGNAQSPPAQPTATSGYTSKQTMVGVAVPGVAPLHPGERRPVAPEPIDSEPPISAPPPSVVPWRIPTGALVLIGVCSVLIFGAVVFSIYYHQPKALNATVAIDENGNELLDITCDNCADGTKVNLDGTSAIINNNSTRLTLHQPLHIGRNAFRIALERPGMGRDEEINVLVPVQFRVRADFTELTAPEPRLGVVVQARPDAVVEVAGKTLTLDGDGTARYSFELGEKLEGMAANTRLLSEDVPYSITIGEAPARSGRIKIKTNVAPLWVEAPGTSAVIEGDRFLLAGATLKGGTISVEGSDIPLDADGRFEQMMSVDSVGETTITVRTQVPDMAPRWVPIKIKRVENLREEAQLFRQTATDQYGGYGHNVASKVGMAVVADGVVEESRIEHQTTAVLLNVQNGCIEGPCLARLLIGGQLELQPQTKLSAFGRISRAVEGATRGSLVPEIRVEFLLPEAK